MGGATETSPQIRLGKATPLFPADIHNLPGSFACPAFSPDGKTVYFTYADAKRRGIMVSHLTGRGWSAPETAPFSGSWRDIEPVMSPDGKYLYFISNRPRFAGGKALDGFFGGQVRPGEGGNLWRVALSQPQSPELLPDIINATSATYSPAITADGSIIFNRPDPYTWKSHLFRAQFHHGNYQEPVALPISDGTIGDFDAAVAPDESFVIFSSNRPPAGDYPILFYIWRQGDSWSKPEPLLPITPALEARLSPDGHTLYYQAEEPSADGSTAHGKIYQAALEFSGRQPEIAR